MTRIDRAFSSIYWADLFINPVVQPLSSSMSDHWSLLLTSLNPPKATPRFRFVSFWVDKEGFHESFSEAWNRTINGNHNPLTTLHIKFTRTAKALKLWSKKLIKQGKIALAIYSEVIAQLEKNQESSQLTNEQRNLIRTLKMRSLSLLAIEKCRARQRSRMTWL
jgi:hypothetical protein